MYKILHIPTAEYICFYNYEYYNNTKWHHKKLKPVVPSFFLKSVTDTWTKNIDCPIEFEVPNWVVNNIQKKKSLYKLLIKDIYLQTNKLEHIARNFGWAASNYPSMCLEEFLFIKI